MTLLDLQIAVLLMILLGMGEGDGHIQSLILTAIFIMMGFQTITIGLLGDTIASNRKILEDVQYRVRKMECGTCEACDLIESRPAGADTQEKAE